MKILLFGGRGWIGQQLRPYLDGEVIDPGDVRADDADGVRALLDDLALNEGDRVVSVIGRTRGPPGSGELTIDYLEDAGKAHDKLVLNIRDNLYGPMTLALACKERNVHFTYLGTGCIFSGTSLEQSFTESSAPNFFGSAYSVVKGFTDRLMAQMAANTLQARIRMPIDETRSPYNFVTKIAGYAKICSVENSMTVLPSLLPLLANMIHKKVLGTVNLTNPGTISHDRVLGLYRDIVDPAFTWTNFTEEEQNGLLKSKRSNNALDTARLQAMYPDVANIENAVIACLTTLRSA